MSTPTYRSRPLVAGDIYERLAERDAERKAEALQEQEIDIALVKEAQEQGLLPEPIPLFPEDPLELSDEEKEKVVARETMHRELLRQSRERHNARGRTMQVKNGKAGRTIGMWFSYETIDALNELSISWEMARTSVVTQLIRQNKGATLRKWIGPVEGEVEKKQAWVKPEENIRLHQRKL